MMQILEVPLIWRNKAISPNGTLDIFEKNE